MTSLKSEINKNYQEASKTEIKVVTNGCGSRGITEKLVSDSLLGLSIRSACNIHDRHYAQGALPRVEADARFLQNMDKIISNARGNMLLKIARRILARVYYIGVRVLGGSHYAG